MKNPAGCALIANGLVRNERIRIDWDLGFRYSQTCEFRLQAGGLLCVLLHAAPVLWMS